MGSAITWFAVKEAHGDDFLSRVHLKPTGKQSEVPESLICSATTQSGWRVLLYNKYTCPFLRKKELSELSTAFDIIECSVEEHCMASSSALWQGGKQCWLISHQGDNAPRGLDVAGKPPDTLNAVRSKYEAQQRAADGKEEDVDYFFEIPLVVAAQITGYKHDEEFSGIVGDVFHVLERDKPPAPKGFFARLFGG